MDANKISQDVMTICDLAKEKLELYQDANDLPATLPFETIDEGLEETYDRTTTIWDNASDSTVPDGIAYVEVTIDWTDQMGAPRSSTFSTMVPKE
jgi:hypothetical protein